MSPRTLILLSGIAAFVITVYNVRCRDLREKYAVLWLGVAFVVLICGIFPGTIETFARECGTQYAPAVMFISLSAIYLFSFSVSVSLTRQYRRNIRLTQELALLSRRVKELEAAQKGER